jgi:hypothetical protein
MNHSYYPKKIENYHKISNFFVLVKGKGGQGLGKGPFVLQNVRGATQGE